MNLILSLFPGIGLLDRAFEEFGFTVVRGPDVLWGGDVRCFHPPAGKFDGVIGGPPCQAFSRLSHMVRHNAQREPERYKVADNLIPEFERCIIEAQPTWWLMENVPDAPDPVIPGYHMTSCLLNNRWLPDATPQNRVRKFWFGHIEWPIQLTSHIEYAVFEPLTYEHAVLASGTRRQQIRLNGGGKPKRLNKSGASRRSVADCLRLQGLPEDFFEHSPLTVAGQQKVLGNGVPLPMGRAVAKAIREITRVAD